MGVRITGRSFPTPDLVKTVNNPAAWDQLGGFAEVQAAEAAAALGVMEERLASAGSRAERVAGFEAAYRHVAEWRYQVALQGQWTRPHASADDVRATIGEGYVSIDRGEAWLENAYIPEYTEGTWTNHAPRRKRKLLLHHTQIDQLAITTRERGVTIVPLKLYFLNGKAKLEIGVGRGKKLYDKRQALKLKDASKEARGAIREGKRAGRAR